jgi:hypothetical protein
MLKSILLVCFILFFNGCTSKVVYSSPLVLNEKNVQEFENKECISTFGPFELEKKPSVEEAIEKSIQKANEMGLYGNILTNVTVKEEVFSAVLISEVCLVISGIVEQDDNKL